MPRFLRSGPFLADTTLRTVAKHGEGVSVTPKVFEALVLFLRSGNRVVSREELSGALWPGQVVTEANLNQHVSMLRKALGDGVGGERYLLTLPGKGYQWVLAVEEREPQAAVTGRRSRVWAWAAGMAGVAVVVAGGWWTLKQGVAGPLRYSPVTRLQGSEFQPAISADGRRVAFVWDEEGSGGSQIYVKEQGRQQQRRVSGGSGACRSPVWSPDGRRLAYVCTAQGRAEVLISEPGGGTERIGELHPPAYGLAARQLDWSPDGTRLAVVDKREERAPFGLWEILLATRERRALTAPPSSDVGDLEPRYSPDGRWLAFGRQKIRFRHELMVVAAGGGEPVRVHGENTEIGGLDWSPGGKALYYSSNPQGQHRIWRVAWTRAGGGTPEATELQGEHPIQFSMARGTGALVYSMFRQDLDIWRLSLGEGAEGWKRLIASTADDSMPQYSPDGTRICFRSNRTGEEQLWVSDAEGGEAVQITQGNVWPTLGRWSPDGQRVVFNQYGTAQSYIVWPGDPGRPPVKVAEAEHPSFSPDGKSVLYVTEGLVQMRALEGGGAAVKIAQHATGGYPTASSADGRWVYFTGGRTDPSVWRAEVASGQKEKVLEGLLPGCWACWALSGERLYFISASAATGADAKLMELELGTRAVRELAEVPPPMAPLGTGALTVTPDGRRFLMVRVNRANTDVVRVEGFR